MLIALFALLGINYSFAQSDVADFLKYGKEDAGVLIESYINPYAKALGVGLNGSWYNSAATHKLFGFDLAFSATGVKIPTSDQRFDVDALHLLHTRVNSNELSSFAPTAAGDGDGIKLDIYEDPNNQSTYLGTLETPGGTGVDFVPIPMVQATFGILPHTDVIGRWVPTVKFDADNDKAEIGLWGLGIKHNFKESLPFIKHLPFDAALFAGYTKISGKTGVTFGFDNYGLPTPSEYNQDENQHAETEITALKYGLIVSKKLSVLTLYVSATGNKTKSTFDLLGRYPIGSEVAGVLVYDDVEDPIQMNIENSYFALDAGLRIKLLFFSMFGSVSKADYVSYNAGISFGFR